MAPTNLEKAETDRSSLTDHLEFLETEVIRHQHTPLGYEEVTMYLTELDETRKMLGPNHSAIRLAAPKNTDMAPYIAEYRRLYQLASRVHAGLHGIKMSFPPPATPSSPSRSTSTIQQKIKLPPLELPKFSGNLQEWVTFRDLFLTAVHNSSLTKVEKFSQLKTLLTGEASRQIRSLVLSEANYDIAWKALTDRYENSRELLFTLLKRIISQPQITSSNAASIRSLIDTTKECIRSLEVLSMPTQHWDAIILYILFSKLDAASRELWEQSLPDTSIPTLSKMYEFLEQRARALAASNVQGPPRQQPKPQQQQVRNHHVQPTQCKNGCSQAHPLFRCNLFQKQTPQQRHEFVRQNKLCHNCLSEGHIASSCPSQTNCKQCNKRHHTMIHLENERQKIQTQQQSSASAHPPPPPVQSHHTRQPSALQTGILATARIRIKTESVESLRRCLIDPGSTNSYITEKAARNMK